MKKILVLAFVMTLGITISFAQTAASTTTEQATPIVKASDMGSTVKCSSEAKVGSCCAKVSADASASTAAAVATSDASTNVVPVAKSGSCCAKPGADASAAKAGEHCKSAAISTSAAKPESEKVNETPEK